MAPRLPPTQPFSCLSAARRPPNRSPCRHTPTRRSHDRGQTANYHSNYHTDDSHRRLEANARADSNVSFVLPADASYSSFERHQPGQY
eukprot:4883586-Prymnesium_polylepis.1